jgi:F-type H+-transporting ATPase subunit b
MQAARSGARVGRYGLWLALGLLSLHVTAGVALAADGGWRPTYDLVMRWVNFIILVAVIVRYARQPVKTFLQARSIEVRIEIEDLEKQKAKAVSAAAAIRQSLADSEARLAEIKTRLLADGERRKEALLEQAEVESAMMLKDAERKIEGLLHKAQATLRGEIVDNAIDLAMERLPREIAPEDHEQLMADFFQVANAS